MSLKHKTLTSLCVLMGVILVAPALFAQVIANPALETAWAADFSTNRIYQVDFDAGTTHGPINLDANALSQVRDILASNLAGGLRLIAADYNGGRVVYYDTFPGNRTVISGWQSSWGPFKPDGLSSNAAGDIFLVSYGNGPTQERFVRIPFNGTTYGSWQTIDANFQTNTLVETEVLTSSIPGFAAGGVFVATNQKVYFYPNAASGSSAGKFLVADFSSGPISEITGMALNFDGTLLLTDLQGFIYNVELSTGLPTEDQNNNTVLFALLGTTGTFKIDVGLQPIGGSYKPVLLLANRGEGSADRFEIVDSGLKRSDNTAILVGASRISVTDVSHARSVAIGGGTVVTEGSFRNIEGPGNTNFQYTQVTESGVLDCTVDTVLATPGASLDSVDPALAGKGIMLPSDIQAFGNGEDEVIVVVCKSTVSNQDVVNLVSPKQLLTNAPVCDPADAAHFLRMPIPGIDEFDPIGGGKWSFITNDCDPRGGGKGTSVFLVDASMDTTFVEISEEQFVDLAAALSFYANFISQPTKNRLNQARNRSFADFEDEDYEGAQEEMEVFLSRIAQRPNDIDNSGTNLTGVLNSLGRSLAYHLCAILAQDSNDLEACAH